MTIRKDVLIGEIKSIRDILGYWEENYPKLVEHMNAQSMQAPFLLKQMESELRLAANHIEALADSVSDSQ